MSFPYLILKGINNSGEKLQLRGNFALSMRHALLGLRSTSREVLLGLHNMACPKHMDAMMFEKGGTVCNLAIMGVDEEEWTNTKEELHTQIMWATY